MRLRLRTLESGSGDVTHPLLVGLGSPLPCPGDIFPARDRKRSLGALRQGLDCSYGLAENPEAPARPAEVEPE